MRQITGVLQTGDFRDRVVRKVQEQQVFALVQSVNRREAIVRQIHVFQAFHSRAGDETYAVVRSADVL